LSTRSSWKDVLKALTEAQKDMVEWNKEEWGPLTPKSKKKGRYGPKSLRSSLTSSKERVLKKGNNMFLEQRLERKPTKE